LRRRRLIDDLASAVYHAGWRSGAIIYFIPRRCTKVAAKDHYRSVVVVSCEVVACLILFGSPASAIDPPPRTMCR